MDLGLIGRLWTWTGLKLATIIEALFDSEVVLQKRLKKSKKWLLPIDWNLRMVEVLGILDSLECLLEAILR